MIRPLLTLDLGNLRHTHAEIVPSVNPFGLLIRQSHHRSIELFPQLLILQDFSGVGG